MTTIIKFDSTCVFLHRLKRAFVCVQVLFPFICYPIRGATSNSEKTIVLRISIISISIATALAVLFPTTASCVPAINNFEDFLAAVPGKDPRQSACLFKGPLFFEAVGSSKNNSSIGGRFYDMFEQIAMGKLLPYAKKHKLIARQLWVWSDLSRWANVDEGSVPNDSTSPILTVLCFEQLGTASNLEENAQKVGKRTGVIANTRIYAFGSDEDASYMAFSGNMVFTSNEKKLLNEFINGTSGNKRSNQLLKPAAWKQIKKEAPICGAMFDPANDEQECSFAINGNECQFTMWGKLDQKTYPEGSMEADMQKKQYDEWGRHVTVTTTPNSTILLIHATDEESASKCFFLLLGRIIRLVV